MSKYDQCEHRLHCGTCVKTGKLCPYINFAPTKETEYNPYDVEPLPRIDWTEDQVSNIPQCCVACPNHPSNGGSGVCNCVLPYMSLTNILQGSTQHMIVNRDNGTYTVDNSQRYNGNTTVTIPYKDSQTEYDPKIPHTYTGNTGIHG